MKTKLNQTSYYQHRWIWRRLGCSRECRKDPQNGTNYLKNFPNHRYESTKVFSNSYEMLATILPEGLAPTVEKEFSSKPGSIKLIPKSTKDIEIAYCPEKYSFTFHSYFNLLDKHVALTKRVFLICNAHRLCFFRVRPSRGNAEPSSSSPKSSHLKTST